VAFIVGYADGVALFHALDRNSCPFLMGNFFQTERPSGAYMADIARVLEMPIGTLAGVLNYISIYIDRTETAKALPMPVAKLPVFIRLKPNTTLENVMKFCEVKQQIREIKTGENDA
jgi:hypothetical protein